jgi:4'-phosphopantetheinyl transferase
VIPDDSCLVWWANVAEHRPRHESVLSAVEVERATGPRRPADRVRQVLGAALLRHAASLATGTPPDRVVVERTCGRCAKPHGRPTLPGTGLHASITHSGDLVGVALTAVAPVGLDVEQIYAVDVAGLSRLVLHADETADGTGFFTYWTRKEAVVKATGDGLTVPLTEVRVSRPDEPPHLHAYPGRATPPAYLADLRPADGYPAAVALLTGAPVTVVELPAAALLPLPHA